MNKKYIMIGLVATFTLFLGFWSYVSFNATGNLSKFVNNNGKIKELYYHQDYVPEGISAEIKLNPVKNLYDYRRYLFFMSSTFYFVDTIGRSRELASSFPKVCSSFYRTYPEWLENLGFLSSLFMGKAIYHCTMIGQPSL